MSKIQNQDSSAIPKSMMLMSDGVFSVVGCRSLLFFYLDNFEGVNCNFVSFHSYFLCCQCCSYCQLIGKLLEDV